jgi:type IV pilus assembly protein PilP
MIRQNLAIALLACLALSACGSERHLDEVRQFVKDSDKMPRGRIPDLPEPKPYEPFEYAAFDLVDPFVPRKLEPPKPPVLAGGIKPPDPARRKGPLEAFPLENLKMVGTLQQKKVFFALIKTPDNNLYRVQTGDFMGQNFGRVTEISESALKLKELVQDSTNEWKEEERTLLLQD